MNPEQTWLEPLREHHLLKRLAQIHEGIASGLPVAQFEALWMAHVLNGLMEGRVAVRAELAAARQRVADLEQGQTLLPVFQRAKDENSGGGLGPEGEFQNQHITNT
jgi:hypothetical protein